MASVEWWPNRIPLNNSRKLCTTCSRRRELGCLGESLFMRRGAPWEHESAVANYLFEAKSHNRISENQWLASLNFSVSGHLRQSSLRRTVPWHGTLLWLSQGVFSSLYSMSRQRTLC